MSKINFDWPYGSGTNEYELIPYSQISEQAPDIPGIYIWLLKTESVDQCISAVNFFNQISIDAEVKGNLRIKYKGTLSKDNRLEDVKNISSPLVNQILNNTFFAIGYPIYIGISKSLSSRLATHQFQFTQAKSKNNYEELNIEDPESDSDQESKYFGSRLANIWPPNLTEDNLYVKLIISSECEKQVKCEQCGKGCRATVLNAMRECETIVNSLFNPVLGRR